MPKPIIYLGASFNPPTKAHRAVVDSLLEKYPDTVVMLAPVYEHIYASQPQHGKVVLIPYEDRKAMTVLAFGDLIAQGKVVLSDVEKFACEDARRNASAGQEPSQVGTAYVLNFMKSHPEIFPELDVDHIALFLGGDTYEHFFGGKWAKVPEIIDRVDAIHVIPRNGKPLLPPLEVVRQASEANEAANNDRVLAGKLDEIRTKLLSTPTKVQVHDAIANPAVSALSSTRIRENLEIARLGVVPAVYDYMVEHQCYPIHNNDGKDVKK